MPNEWLARDLNVCRGVVLRAASCSQGARACLSWHCWLKTRAAFLFAAEGGLWVSRFRAFQTRFVHNEGGRFPPLEREKTNDETPDVGCTEFFLPCAV